MTMGVAALDGRNKSRGWHGVWKLLAEALPTRYELSLEGPLAKVAKPSRKSNLPPWPELPMRTQAYFAFVIMMGGLLLLLEWRIDPFLPQWTTVGELVYLGVGVQLSALMPLKMESGIHYMGSLFLMAAGLVAPGLGVSLVAWLTVYDGRKPGRDIPIYAFLYNGANYAVTYGVMTMLVAYLVPADWFWALPVKTTLLTALVIVCNSSLTAKAISILSGQKFWVVFKGGMGVVTVRSLMLMGVLGGLLVVVLMQLVGYVMGLGIFGALVAIRSNTADAQAQALERKQTLQLTAKALDARDHYTRNHSQRVADMAAKIGEAMGLRTKDVERLRTAGILHDLGKIGIRDGILNTTEKLTDDEWKVLKTHPDIGAEMIADHSALASLAPIVRGHHERWDGRGYPDGLKGEEIPLGARILAVSDSFDTITGARIYRPSKMTVPEALADINNLAGSWYDPKVVSALLKVHESEEVGESQVSPGPAQAAAVVAEKA